MKSSNSSRLSDDFIQIGKIIGAHGIKGAVKVYSYAESPDRFAPGTKIALMDDDGGLLHCAVRGSQPHKNVIRLTLDGVTTRDQAESLVGRAIWFDKRALPPLDEDTYYWNDLIGMQVYTTDDEYLGKIDHIIPTGANDVYVVKTPADHATKEILLPAITTVVIEVDVELNRMRVELPDGLV